MTKLSYNNNFRPDGFVVDKLIRHFIITVLALSIPFLDFPGLGGGMYIRPLSLGLMAIFLLVQLFFFTGQISILVDRPTRLVGVFLLWGVVGCAVMPWIIGGEREFKGQSLEGRILRDLSSLIAGGGAWLYIRSLLHDTSSVRCAAKWIARSFWLVAVVGVIQALVVVTQFSGFVAIDHIFSFFRSRPDAPYSKIYCFAPEASMFADQLVTLYLPFAFSRLAVKPTLCKQQIGYSNLDWIKIVLCILLLIFTQSRIGLFSFLAFLCVAALLKAKSAGRISVARIMVGLGMLFLICMGLYYFAGTRVDIFLSSIGGVDASIEGGVWSNVTRMGSIVAALQMFVSHPIGVGTGAFAFHFREAVPDWALISPEIQGLLGASSDYLLATVGSTGGDIAERLPDAKALPARVLAEMGIPGFAILAYFWWYQVRCGYRVFKNSIDSDVKAIALGSVVALCMMLPLSFSVNSYIWVHWIFISAMLSALVAAEHGRGMHE